ncbi:MAG: UDP-N-acetylmuramate dehydrogenase [Minisyncoccia bacterium]|jgi:UDP-N-acetylmuramate dehydrogenase
MNLQENISLAPFTTFHIGGPARFFIEARTEKEIKNAIARARKLNLPIYLLGAGSNLLVPDIGVEGIVLKIALHDIAFENESDAARLIAGAGTLWETVVNAASKRGLFGIENLAGIPGTMGGASVQNIGAYGAELADTFDYADVVDSITGAQRRINRTEAAFGYRTSFFKEHRTLIIIRTALRFSKQAFPNITYPNLIRAQEAGTPLQTPSEIARAVRVIRSEMFSLTTKEGTAGSFFKNPIISNARAEQLSKRFPGLPLFPERDNMVKIPLAWLLDHALSLKGFSKGRVRLYEKQPLVIVARAGATAADVDAFARKIAERVLSMTDIVIEREVETFGTR